MLATGRPPQRPTPAPEATAGRPIGVHHLALIRTGCFTDEEALAFSDAEAEHAVTQMWSRPKHSDCAELRRRVEQDIDGFDGGT